MKEKNLQEMTQYSTVFMSISEIARIERQRQNVMEFSTQLL